MNPSTFSCPNRDHRWGPWPFSLSALATLGFGHNTVEQFDGAMRVAFCVDGGYEQHAGVAVRQHIPGRAC